MAGRVCVRKEGFFPRVHTRDSCSVHVLEGANDEKGGHQREHVGEHRFKRIRRPVRVGAHQPLGWSPGSF